MSKYLGPRKAMALRFPPSLKKALVRAARSQSKSLNNLIIERIIYVLDKQGGKP